MEYAGVSHNITTIIEYIENFNQFLTGTWWACVRQAEATDDKGARPEASRHGTTLDGNCRMVIILVLPLLIENIFVTVVYVSFGERRPAVQRRTFVFVRRVSTILFAELGKSKIDAAAVKERGRTPT